MLPILMNMLTAAYALGIITEPRKIVISTDKTEILPRLVLDTSFVSQLDIKTITSLCAQVKQKEVTGKIVMPITIFSFGKQQICKDVPVTI
jgi:hypothetical protein